MTQFDHRSGQHLQVGDARLYCEQAGDPSGKPLVLLHGGLGSLADFDTVVGDFCERFRVIGIDLRGHGASTLGSTPLTYERHQQDVAQVLDQLGIQSCAMLGFSDGGIVAYRLAAHAPARINALVAIGAQWTIAADSPVLAMLAGLTTEMWLEMFPASGDHYRSVNPEADFDRLVRAVVASWTDLGVTGYPHGMVEKITAPTLIIRGDGDQMLSLSEAMQLQDLITGAHLFNVPFAGHEVHKDAPALTMAAVIDFFLRPRKRPCGG